MPEWLTMELAIIACLTPIVTPALAWSVSLVSKLDKRTVINEVRIAALEGADDKNGARLLRMEQKIDNLCKELHEIMGIIRHK